MGQTNIPRLMHGFGTWTHRGHPRNNELMRMNAAVTDRLGAKVAREAVRQFGHPAIAAVALRAAANYAEAHPHLVSGAAGYAKRRRAAAELLQRDPFED